VLIYASENSLKYLRKAKIIFGDGTFKICPSPFYQLYVIHGLLFGISVPLVYTFMKSKNSISYGILFSRLSNYLQNLEYLIIDFEQAVFKTAFETIPHVTVHSCFFHLGQSMWRKIQSYGFSNDYKCNKNFRVSVKKLLLLCYFPIERVISELKMIDKSCEGKDFFNKYDEILSFFCKCVFKRFQ
jgi:hypothetical protein